MLSLTRTLLALSFAVFSSAVTVELNPRQGAEPDFTGIVGTVKTVNQVFSLPYNALPDQATQKTVVTANNGQLTGVKPVVAVAENGTAALTRRQDGERWGSSPTPTFKEVFKGKVAADGSPDLDCAFEGIAYLGYTVVPNATYSTQDCVTYCQNKQGCVFANIYYEYNNPLLDWVFHEKSNLKCVLWGDYFPASSKSNCGGQQLAPEGWEKTSVKRSSAYALQPYPEPAVPSGYWKIFGPISWAIRAPGYSTYVLLSHYDVSACSAQCDAANGCVYFNLWRALEGETPKSYVCTLYTLNRSLISAAQATYEGQAGIKVTWSRGYFKISGLKQLLGDIWQWFFGRS